MIPRDAHPLESRDDRAVEVSLGLQRPPCEGVDTDVSVQIRMFPPGRAREAVRFMDQKTHVPIVGQYSECLTQGPVYRFYERDLLLLTVSASHLDENTGHESISGNGCILYHAMHRVGAGYRTMPAL